MVTSDHSASDNTPAGISRQVVTEVTITAVQQCSECEDSSVTHPMTARTRGAVHMVKATDCV